MSATFAADPTLRDEVAKLRNSMFTLMNCPDCQTEMHPGYLKASGRSIDWFFDEQSGLAKFFGAGQHITNLMGKVQGAYCPKCGYIKLSEIKLKMPKS